MLDALFEPEKSPRVCGEVVEVEMEDGVVEALRHISEAPYRVEAVVLAWSVCVRNFGAIGVDLRAGEVKEVEINRE